MHKRIPSTLDFVSSSAETARNIRKSQLAVFRFRPIGFPVYSKFSIHCKSVRKLITPAKQLRLTPFAFTGGDGIAIFEALGIEMEFSSKNKNNNLIQYHVSSAVIFVYDFNRTHSTAPDDAHYNRNYSTAPLSKSVTLHDL